MKKLVRNALISVALGTAANAAPFLAIGDGAELFVTGTLGVRSDDNIFLSNKETSDTIFDINPGVEITFGKNAALKGSLSLVDSFANYSDNSKLNTNLFSGDFLVGYDDAKLKMKFNTGYHELNQNTVDNRGLTRRDEFVIGGSAEVEVSQITSVGAGINFNHTNNKRKGYGDTDELTIPVNFYYKWTPKMDLSLGYQYRDFQTNVGLDSKDHFFNVGARGEFTEKLTGQVRIGVNNRKFSVGSDETLPGIDASVTYAITPKTSLQLGASNDFGTAPQGQQQKNLAFNGSITTKFDEQWSLVAGLGNRSIDYYKDKKPRTDENLTGNLGVTYIVNTYVKITATYNYGKNDSDLVSAAYTNNVFGISASVRY